VPPAGVYQSGTSRAGGQSAWATVNDPSPDGTGGITFDLVSDMSGDFTFDPATQVYVVDIHGNHLAPVVPADDPALNPVDGHILMQVDVPMPAGDTPTLIVYQPWGVYGGSQTQGTLEWTVGE
jgi:hypothetical protein